MFKHYNQPFFLSAFFNIKNFWKSDNLSQHVTQNLSILYVAVVPQLGHLSRYIWAIFSFTSIYFLPAFSFRSIKNLVNSSMHICQQKLQYPYVLYGIGTWYTPSWWHLLQRTFFSFIYFIPTFLNSKNLWKGLSFIKQLIQYSAIGLKVCWVIPQLGHWVSYVLGLLIIYFLSTINFWKLFSLLQQGGQIWKAVIYLAPLLSFCLFVVTTQRVSHLLHFIVLPISLFSILRIIPQLPYVVKTLLSNFIFARVMVAAHVFLQRTPNSSAECPTRIMSVIVPCGRIKKTDKRITFRPITWEYG
jgi:hypothetical protein